MPISREELVHTAYQKGKLTIALSSTKVEYQALTNASTEYMDMASILI